MYNNLLYIVLCILPFIASDFENVLRHTKSPTLYLTGGARRSYLFLLISYAFFRFSITIVRIYVKFHSGSMRSPSFKRGRSSPAVDICCIHRTGDFCEVLITLPMIVRVL